MLKQISFKFSIKSIPYTLQVADNEGVSCGFSTRENPTIVSTGCVKISFL
jgi:hypothetical protein